MESTPIVHDLHNEQYVNELARSPEWCPCDPHTFPTILAHLQRGNRLMLHAMVQHMYTTSFADQSVTDLQVTQPCCRRHLSLWSTLHHLLPEYPTELHWFRVCFEHSHVSLISHWIEYDQLRRVLPPIHSETYAILFHHWIRTKPTHPSRSLWLLHILSRLRVEHLHPPLLPPEAFHELQQHPVLQTTLKECQHKLTEWGEFHPLVIPTLQRFLHQWISVSPHTNNTPKKE